MALAASGGATPWHMKYPGQKASALGCNLRTTMVKNAFLQLPFFCHFTYEGQKHWT